MSNHEFGCSHESRLVSDLYWETPCSNQASVVGRRPSSIVMPSCRTLSLRRCRSTTTKETWIMIKWHVAPCRIKRDDLHIQENQNIPSLICTQFDTRWTEFLSVKFNISTGNCVHVVMHPCTPYSLHLRTFCPIIRASPAAQKSVFYSKTLY